MATCRFSASPRRWSRGACRLAIACLALAPPLVGEASQGDGLSAAGSAPNSRRAPSPPRNSSCRGADFLPDLIRSRERAPLGKRKDAAPYWTDPRAWKARRSPTRPAAIRCASGDGAMIKAARFFALLLSGFLSRAASTSRLRA
jgi:hypothetical protein